MSHETVLAYANLNLELYKERQENKRLQEEIDTLNKTTLPIEDVKKLFRFNYDETGVYIQGEDRLVANWMKGEGIFPPYIVEDEIKEDNGI